MAGGTGEAIINVPAMFAETCVRQDLIEVVALPAQGIGPVNREIRIGKKVCHPLSRSRSLAQLVATLQNVEEFRSVRAIGSSAAKFPIVIAVVAVGAQNARAHRARGAGSIQIQHLAAQARLRQDAAPLMHHRVARGGGGAELRDQVQRISSGDLPNGKVTILCRIRRLS